MFGFVRQACFQPGKNRIFASGIPMPEASDFGDFVESQLTSTPSIAQTPKKFCLFNIKKCAILKQRFSFFVENTVF